MRNCPKLLATSTWLDTRKGHCATYGLVLVSPVAARFFKVKSTFALIASGICIITALGTVALWACMWEIQDTGNRRVPQVQQHHLQQLQTSSAAGSLSSQAADGGAQHARKCSIGDLALLAARAKVKQVLTFVVCMGAVKRQCNDFRRCQRARSCGASGSVGCPLGHDRSTLVRR